MHIANTPFSVHSFDIPTTLCWIFFFLSFLLMASGLRTTRLPNSPSQHCRCSVWSFLLFQPSDKLFSHNFPTRPTAHLNASPLPLPAGDGVAGKDGLACWMLSPLTIWGRSGTSFSMGVASSGGGWSAIMSGNHSWTTAPVNRLWQQESDNVGYISPLAQAVPFFVCQTGYQCFRRKLQQCLQDVFFSSTKQTLTLRY